MNWTIQRLKALFDNTEENQHLEFKGGEFLKKDCTNDLTKQITGFANSDGGNLIIGLQEVKRDGKTYAVDFSTFDGDLWNRERVENLIDSNVSPRVPGIVIHPIRMDDDIHRTVYVIEIPKSNTCHQASDDRYYFRLDVSTKPMKDFQVRDVMNRAQSTNLELSFGVSNRKSIHVGIQNKGSIVCRNWAATFSIPESSILLRTGIGDHPIITKDVYQGVNRLKIDFGKIETEDKNIFLIEASHVFKVSRLRTNESETIFPRSVLNIINIEAQNIDLGKLIVYWQIDSDDGQRTYGIFTPTYSEVYKHDSLTTDAQQYYEF